MLATILAGVVGGDKEVWAIAIAIGAVQVYPMTFRVRGNWQVSPTGSADQIEAINEAVAIVAAEHPYARSRTI
jgi:hypothetical protein